jgi:hypothetical protein
MEKRVGIGSGGQRERRRCLAGKAPKWLLGGSQDGG